MSQFILATNNNGVSRYYLNASSITRMTPYQLTNGEYAVSLNVDSTSFELVDHFPTFDDADRHIRQLVHVPN